MKVPTEDVVIDEEDTSPPRKKLKQARLPFQVLSPSVVESPPDVKFNKKRKLSDGSLDDSKLLKVAKTNEIVETKENLCTPVCIDLGQEATQVKQVEDELAVKVTNSNCIDSEQKQGICSDLQERKHISPESRCEDKEVIVLSDSENDEVQLEKKILKPTICQNKIKRITVVQKSSPIGKLKVRDNTTPKRVLRVIKKTTTVQVKVSKNKKTPISVQNAIKKKIGTEKKIGINSSITSQAHETNDTSLETKKIQKQNIINKNNFSAKGQAKVSKPKVSKPGATSKTKQKLEQNEGTKHNTIGAHFPTSKQEANSVALEPKTKEGQCLLDEQSTVSKKTISDSTVEEVSITQSKADMADNITPTKKVRSDSENLESASDADSPNNENSSVLKVGVVTPKQNSADVDITPTSSRRMTPKQVQKQLDSAKKKEEKEKQKQEKEKKRAEEKEEKQRYKLEKEEQKKKEREEKEEQKKKEREEKDEQKKKEKEEKEKKRLAELEMKSEEKKVKDEEKRKKEEQRLSEKRKRDEKKQAEEDAKRKEAAVFTSFFRAPRNDCKPSEEVKIKTENFMPFEVKADMRLAPLVRTWFGNSRRNFLDEALSKQEEKQPYLKQLTQENYTVGNCGKTWPLSEFRDEVVILDDDENEMAGSAGDNLVIESHSDISLPRPKLLQFWENQRPPYWGTWRKKSTFIKPTEPFGKDEKLFDYEVDSDEEWEEEEPGESLHGSDDEKESEDEYEVDNEFFVPHGYLSDEENECEEDEALSPETLKAKLKLLELEFEEEMKHKTERIKPRVIGCIWTNANTDPVGVQLLKLLSSRRAVFRDGPIVTSTADSGLTTGSPSHETPADKVPPGPKKTRFPDNDTPSLIKLVHGNINGRGFLVKEFFTYWRKQESLQNNSNGEVNAETNDDITVPVTVNAAGISKKSIANKIKEIASYGACPDEGPMMGRSCWYVSSDLRSSFGLEDLTIPNKEWNYNLTPKRREIELMTFDPSTSVDSSPKSKKKLPLITKFTKKMSRKELQKQFEVIGNPVNDITEVKPEVTNSSSQLSDNLQNKLSFFKPRPTMASSQAKKQHKRVPILMSVAVGQNIPKSHNLKPNVSGPSLELRKSESKSLTNTSSSRTNTPTTGTDNKTTKSSPMVVDDSDCIVLSD